MNKSSDKTDLSLPTIIHYNNINGFYIYFPIRWPGASLILIRGHRHLHECAYIGDDSSEELNELIEIVAEGGTIQLVCYAIAFFFFALLFLCFFFY